MGFGRDGGRDGGSGRDEKMTAEPIRHRAVIPYSPTHSQNFYDGSGDGWVTAVTDRMTDEMPSFHPSLPRVRGGRDEWSWRTMPPTLSKRRVNPSVQSENNTTGAEGNNSRCETLVFV